MKVRFIKKSTIEGFVVNNPRTRSSFQAWLKAVKYADWNEPSGIVTSFNSADILGRSSKRVVFNIGGNNYRMICTYHFGMGMVHLFVNWIGSHKAYA